MERETEYAFRPGTRTYRLDGGAVCTIHAGDGVTVEQMEGAVRLYLKYKEENEKMRKGNEDAAA